MARQKVADVEKCIKRFWSKVNKNGSIPAHCPALGACWIWTAGKDEKGYGRFFDGEKQVKAHAFSFRTSGGRLSDGQIVCHRCDNRPCVNPTHLFAGTQAENVADQVQKGRHISPERWKKLTPEKVAEIKRLYATGGHSHRELAAQFGTNHRTIGFIVTGKRWSWVA